MEAVELDYGVFSFANIDGRNHQGCCASLCVADVAVAVAVASYIMNRTSFLFRATLQD
jgi:hypothetical protein